jgi:ubiquinone/menaquinone biosynthesis C-methylase UbiE
VTADPSLLEYYARRATEYEAIYAKPERQADLSRLRARLGEVMRGRRVLELACGTGVWTQVIAEVAASVVATDVVDEVLAIAQRKAYPPGLVSFDRLDAFALPSLRGRFTAVFAGFLWSHVDRRRLGTLLATLTRAVGDGVRVVFLDNRFVAGSSTPISRRDEDGNSYQRRRLGDGSEHEVLKNFPKRAELLAAVRPVGEQAVVEELEYYWLLSFVTSQPDRSG